MAVVRARIIGIDFNDGLAAAQEATICVEHRNGDLQYLVVPVSRMTEHIPAQCNVSRTNGSTSRPCRLKLGHKGPHKFARATKEGA